MKKSLLRIMMVLALVGIMTMPGILSCKKESEDRFSSDPDPVYQNQNHTPLPSTCLLLGSGLAAMAGWRRFRKS